MNDYEKLAEEVAKVEIEYIAAKEPFTSLDIGNELKERKINARQRDISPIIREHFNEGSIYANSHYTRTLIPVKDQSAQAFLYFHLDSDPNDYFDTDQNTLPFDPSKPMFAIDCSIDDKIDIASAGANDQFYASLHSSVMHKDSCPYVSRIKAENKVSFAIDDDLAADYRACKREN